MIQSQTEADWSGDDGENIYEDNPSLLQLQHGHKYWKASECDSIIYYRHSLVSKLSVSASI